MAYSKNIIDKDSFEKMMEDVDIQLGEEGVCVSKRPIFALSKIAQTLNIELPILPKIFYTFNENDFSLPAIIWQIDKWYQRFYNGKTKLDFSQGSFVLLIRGQPFKATIPTAYGQPELNLLDYIEGLTPELCSRLPKEEIDEIKSLFLSTYYAFNKYLSSDFQKNKAALTKLEKAVKALMQEDLNKGDALRDSLLFVEILLKNVIEKNNQNYKRTHNLRTLLDKIPRDVADSISYDDIEQVQCDANVTYDKNLTTLEEAIKAHHASLRIFAQIMSAMYPDDFVE